MRLILLGLLRVLGGLLDLVLDLVLRLLLLDMLRLRL